MTPTKTGTKTSSAAAAQEVEATSDGYVLVPLTSPDGDSKDVHALLATKWRGSANRALNSGDFDGFMRRVLHEDDYDTYLDLDPDMEGIVRFAEAVSDASQEAVGKLFGSATSSKSTPRR